jgi:hypothetical protein
VTTNGLHPKEQVSRNDDIKSHEYLDLDKGVMENIKHLIYKRGIKDTFMRGYGDTSHAKLEKIGKETIYTTIRGTSLKFYKIQNFSIKQVRLNKDGKPEPAGSKKGTSKPKGAINVSFFA